MVLAIIGFTLDGMGKVLLGVTVYFVHTRIIKEGKVDKKVLREMQKERRFALVGVVLIILGYFMHLIDGLSGGLI